MERSNRTISGIVFNIQKFSVNDGPGIRTVVFLKGCPLQCRWCANPESQLPGIQILWDQKKCLNCLSCVSLCPVQAVSCIDSAVHIDHKTCIGCQKCSDNCPGRALSPEGEIKTVSEVIKVVLQDKVFYEESGGGITLSGGEMLSQPTFSANLLLAAKEEGLHTCCETTGFAKPEIFAEVTQNADLLLFDMKHWDSQKHKAGTGVTNELPLLNMKQALAAGKEILPRIPVIPGFNDSQKDAIQFCRLLKELGIPRCQLLPFHQFGENKYHLLNQDYAYENMPSLHRDELDDYRLVFESCCIEAFF